MAEVVSLEQAREKREPHLSGPVYCVGCHHEWVGVAPLGTLTMECPECGLPKGFWKYAFGSANGDLYYFCNHCGSEAFSAYKRNGEVRLCCMGCGYDQFDGIFGE